MGQGGEAEVVEGEKDVVGSGSVLRGGGVCASRGADFLLVGMFMCGIWMLDGDGTAPDLDDGDGGWGGDVDWTSVCGGFASGEQTVRVCGDCAGVNGWVGWL